MEKIHTGPNEKNFMKKLYKTTRMCGIIEKNQ